MHDTDRTQRLWIRDGWQTFPIHQVPVDALVLNVDNRRFRAELMWAEDQLGRSFDPENTPEDERSIESLLLDTSLRLEGDRIEGSPTEDSVALKNDWERRRQESPFWIRPDGTVRNGNRRLAMIKRLQREGGDVGLQWVDAVILDEGQIDEAALLEMEQREQLTENFKVRYNDIDYLLALQEAAQQREVDWFDRNSMEEVAGELQTMVEKSKGEVLRDLFAIKYMDQFLEDSGQPHEYHRMLRTLERFRDIGRTMMRVEEEYPLEADQIIQVLFAAVRSGAPHEDIRVIRQMLFKDRNRFSNLASEVAHAEGDWEPDQQSLGSPSAADSEVDVEDDAPGEGPGPEVRNYPKAEVGAAIQVGIDGFQSSRKDNLLQVLREVRNRLEALDDRDRLRRACQSSKGDTTLVGELQAIVDWAEAHRDLIHGNDG